MEKVRIKKTPTTEKMGIGGWCGYVIGKYGDILTIEVRDIDGEYDEYTISSKDVELMPDVTQK